MWYRRVMEGRFSARLALAGLALAGLALVACATQLAPARPPPAERGLKLTAAPSGARVALVIGNGAYPSGQLKNPPNDARLVADTLRRIGFDVTLASDAGAKDMKRAIRDFGDHIPKGGTALFYYAGHGIQVEGRNYLVPVDAEIRDERDVDVEALRLDAVLAEIARGQSRVNVVILDACRNNPFARSFRSAAQGLAFSDAPSGTLVAYATAPGSVAEDGDGQDSAYSSALAAAMLEPGVTVEDAFKLTRTAVRQATAGRQVPWESSSLEGEFYFVGAAGVASPLAKLAPIAVPQLRAALDAPVTVQPNPTLPDGAPHTWLAIKFARETLTIRPCANGVRCTRGSDDDLRGVDRARVAEAAANLIAALYLVEPADVRIGAFEPVSDGTALAAPVSVGGTPRQLREWNRVYWSIEVGRFSAVLMVDNGMLIVPRDKTGLDYAAIRRALGELIVAGKQELSVDLGPLEAEGHARFKLTRRWAPEPP